jgi:hypothetical protein
MLKARLVVVEVKWKEIRLKEKVDRVAKREKPKRMVKRSRTSFRRR